MTPEKTYDDVRLAFDNGTILNASKIELEQYLLAIGRSRILNDANQARASQMGETIRLILAARQSQEMHRTSTIIALVALLVSIAAAGLSFAQVVLALKWPNASRNTAISAYLR